jgi:hypothetical protein
MHQCTNEDLIKHIVKIYSQEFQWNLFHNFLSFKVFSTYFRILPHFLENLNRKGKRKTGHTVVGRIWPKALAGWHGPVAKSAQLTVRHGVQRTRGGVAIDGERHDEVWRRRQLQNEDHCRRAPDKVSGGEAHRSERSTTRWAEAARRQCPSTAAALRWPSMAPGGSYSTRPTQGRWGVTLIRRKRAWV